MMKYVVYDLEPNDSPIFAICNSAEGALEEQKRLAQEFAEELFNADPKETGIDKDNPCDVEKVLNDCMNIIGIQMVDTNSTREVERTAYFVAHTQKGFCDFNHLCNRIEYDKSPVYCKFINETADADILLALIPHSEIRGIERIEM